MMNSISRLPIAKSEWLNQLEWGLNCTKTIKLKDIYCLINMDSHVNDLNVNWVWKLKVPPRVQFFWWKTIWGRLPCKRYLYERGIINETNAYYDICSQVLEDVSHILISYLYTVDC